MRKRTKRHRVDGDAVDVKFAYDERSAVWLGEYPYFEEEPRHTASGRPWRNVTYTGCSYASHPLKDCGTCPNLKRQRPTDLIGVCFHEEMRLRE
ncbi:MAG: hypothetical protein IJB85_03965 [Clostridia bacterium]|nr:hypothetical protein [Clostridia bacterium]